MDQCMTSPRGNQDGLFAVLSKTVHEERMGEIERDGCDLVSLSATDILGSLKI